MKFGPSKAIAKAMQTERETAAGALSPLFQAIADAQAAASNKVLKLVGSDTTDSVWSKYAVALDGIVEALKDVPDSEKGAMIAVMHSDFDRIVPELDKQAAFATLRSYRSRFNRMLNDVPYTKQYRETLLKCGNEELAKMADKKISELSYANTSAIVKELKIAGTEPESEDTILIRKEFNTLKDLFVLAIDGQKAVKETEKREGKEFVAEVDRAELLAYIRSVQDQVRAMSKDATRKQLESAEVEQANADLEKLTRPTGEAESGPDEAPAVGRVAAA